MKQFLIKLGIFMLKVTYAPMKLLKTKNKIVYISRESDEPPLDFILLKTEINKLDGNIKNIMLTKKLKKGLLNSICYMVHMLKQMYNLATAKIVILDTYCIVVSLLKHKKETKVIQLWHAMGAIKKFGHQTIGKLSGADARIAEIMCMHKNYDYVLAPSPITKDYYCKAFNVNESNIKYIGMPRIDYILKKKDTTKIYEEYPELKEKINVLYVPTFRKGKKIKLDKLIEKFDTNKYNLIIKLHPLDHKKYKNEAKAGIIFENKFTAYELFSVADRIVTDYSSLAIEVSLLEKPLYFYTYDLEEYKKDPGLNFDFEKEEIGKYMAKTPEKLLELLEQQYDYSALKNFKNKYITVNTKNCTNELAKYILELINSGIKEKTKKNSNKASKEEFTV